jgi:hypothetical protein
MVWQQRITLHPAPGESTPPPPNCAWLPSLILWRFELESRRKTVEDMLTCAAENRHHIQGVPETARRNVTRKQTVNKKEEGENTGSMGVRIRIRGPFAVN